MDNITTIAYINKQGGTKSPLMLKEAIQVLCWADRNLKNLSTVFLTGKLNAKADWFSRQQIHPGEWSLHPTGFHSICDLWGRPTMDLFASKVNAKIPRYFARFWDTTAVVTDAFSVHWDFHLAYAFPPWPLIPATLEKVRTDGINLILVAPDWPCRPWYSDLLILAVAPPFRLPFETRPSTSRSSEPSQFLLASSVSLAFERSRLEEAGFSSSVIQTLLGSRRASTSRTYYRTWDIFCDWCSKSHISGKTASISDVLNFL
nr:PREDICTED: uncharacterized protein LOC106703684 [Latimeria chalumnae]|eukprot:XP_014344483.1 PREDICTED: uncharacterized protein LOC106703684 [Latimeria chalumnae]